MSGDQISARVVLFGNKDPGEALAQSGGWSRVMGKLPGALGRLSQGGRAAMERELSSAITGLLNVKLGSVLVAGLRKHSGLVAAARATAARPGSTEVVQLATHRITTAHGPHLDIVVNGARLATLNFELRITFDVDAVVATVRDARLVALHSGRCTVRVAFECEGIALASRDALLDPALTANLGDGISLLSDEPHAAAPAQAPAAGRAAVSSADHT